MPKGTATIAERIKPMVTLKKLTLASVTKYPLDHKFPIAAMTSPGDGKKIESSWENLATRNHIIKGNAKETMLDVQNKDLEIL